MPRRLSEKEFVRQAILALRDEKRSLGIHTRYSGFNTAFLSYFHRPPRDILLRLAESGVIAVRHVKGGEMIYLAEESPIGTSQHPKARGLSVTAKAVDELKFHQLRQRADWPAVFSCNRRKEVWVFQRWGWTPDEDRYPVKHPLLDEIVDIYLQIRRRGGRLFINSNGAYFRPQGESLLWFVLFSYSKAIKRARGSRSRGALRLAIADRPTQ